MGIFRLAVVVMLTGLAGCTSIERFQGMMDGYIGQPIDEIQQIFGYNHIERELDIGGRAYTWSWQKHGVTPGHSTPTSIHSYSSGSSQHVTVRSGTYFPPEAYELACEFSFMTDTAGIVTAWRAHGNGCAAYPGPGKVYKSAIDE